MKHFHLGAQHNTAHTHFPPPPSPHRASLLTTQTQQLKIQAAHLNLNFREIPDNFLSQILHEKYVHYKIVTYLKFRFNWHPVFYLAILFTNQFFKTKQFFIWVQVLPINIWVFQILSKGCGSHPISPQSNDMNPVLIFSNLELRRELYGHLNNRSTWYKII